ncbi:polysaccharide biosynthesis/export family protein [soil metagenome]
MALTLSRIVPLALLLTACSTTQSIRPVEREAAAFAPWSDQASPYRLGVGDRLHLDFLLTPEMAHDAVVEPDGFVSLKLGLRVEAQNRTAAELEAAIRDAAASRLRQPIVALSLVEARAARIIVGGAVARPGVYPLPARPSTLEAVMLAGGFSPESRMDQVVIIRQRPDGPPMLRTVDLRRFVSNGDAGESIVLASEDMVFVPRSRIAEVDLWIDQNINRVLPFSRSVNLTNTAGLR